MSTSDREWMYRMTDNSNFLSLDYIHKVDMFLDFAYSNDIIVETNVRPTGEIVFQIKCPFTVCKNNHYRPRDVVKEHLLTKGFIRNYTRWVEHGEIEIQDVGESSTPMEVDDDHDDGMTRMVWENIRAAGFQSNPESSSWEEHVPNERAKRFYDMLENENEPLYNGCEEWSKLEAATTLLNWKSTCNVPESTFNHILTIFKSMLPVGNTLPSNLYETSKILKELSLPKKRYHACQNHCMLFYKYDLHLKHNIQMRQRFMFQIQTRYGFPLPPTGHANGEVDNGEVIRSITEILTQYYREAWPTWTSIPKEDQKKMFERFKLDYCSNPTINTAVEGIFNVACGRRLSDRLSWARAAAYEKAAKAGHPVTDHDISSIAPYNPPWMKQEYWSKLVTEHWNTESWLNISKVNKDNRGKYVAGYHCTGSAGHVSFREKLEKKEGPQSSLSFLIKSHTKKEKRDNLAAGEGTSQIIPSSEDLIDNRAREVVERLKASMIQKYGEDFTTHPKHDPELWEEATGKRKKGRSFCTGASSDPTFVLTSTTSVNSSSSCVQTSVQEVERVKQTMEEMRVAHEKAKSDMEERETKIREAHEKAKKEMEEREERLKTEVEDVRREMREQMAKLLKHLPNLEP